MVARERKWPEKRSGPRNIVARESSGQRNEVARETQWPEKRSGWRNVVAHSDPRGTHFAPERDRFSYGWSSREDGCEVIRGMIESTARREA